MTTAELLCEDEKSTRIVTIADAEVPTRSGHCLYCNQAVIGGGRLHDYCRDDYAWEIKMKAMNKMWRPA